MHVLSFTAKRVHLRWLMTVKRVARDFRVTPARFDVLYALLKRGGTALQSEIVRILHLHKTTVSKLLKKLAKLGYVRIFRGYWDGRVNVVQFTEHGRRVTDIAVDYILTSGWTDVGHFGAFQDRRLPVSDEEVVDRQYDYRVALRRVADHFGDEST